jgi:hypothetical protein
MCSTAPLPAEHHGASPEGWAGLTKLSRCDGLAEATPASGSAHADPGDDRVELYQPPSTSGNPIPTIPITAYPDDSVWKRALSAGVIGYLSKL